MAAKLNPTPSLNQPTATYGNTNEGVVLQAVDKTAHALSPLDTNFHSFGFSSTKFVVSKGDLYLPPIQLNAQIVRLKFAGQVSAIAAATTMQLHMLVGGVLLADTGAVSVNTAYSNPYWTMDLEMGVKSNVGTTATALIMRAFYALGFATSNPGVQTLCVVTSGGSASLTNNAVLAIDLQVKFSTAAGNTITCNQATYELELPNYQYVT